MCAKVILDDGFGGDGSLAGVMAMETFLEEFNNEVPHGKEFNNEVPHGKYLGPQKREETV